MENCVPEAEYFGTVIFSITGMCCADLKKLNLVKLIWLSKASHLLIFILFDKENKECPG